MEGGVSPLPTEWSGRCREPRAAAPQKFACNVTTTPYCTVSDPPDWAPQSQIPGPDLNFRPLPASSRLRSASKRGPDRGEDECRRAGGRAGNLLRVRPCVRLSPAPLGPERSDPRTRLRGPERAALSVSKRSRQARSQPTQPEPGPAPRWPRRLRPPRPGAKGRGPGRALRGAGRGGVWGPEGEDCACPRDPERCLRVPVGSSRGSPRVLVGF